MAQPRAYEDPPQLPLLACPFLLLSCAAASCEKELLGH